MEHEKVLRINELAKIKKERSLTPEEDAERKALHQEYIAGFRQNMEAVLQNVRVKQPDGSLRLYAGGYSYYKEKEREEEEETEKAEKAQSAPPAVSEKREAKKVQERPARDAKRRLSFGEQKEYAEIEGVIASKEGELKVVRLEMQQNASDYTRLAELGREETRLAAELDHLMERWAYLEEIAEQQDS